MKQQGKIWIFYDAKAKNQTKPLNPTQAQALILNLLKQKNTKIYLWTPGWNEWMEMNIFLESDQDYFVVPPSVKNKIDDKTQLTSFSNEKTQLISSFDEDKTVFVEATATSVKPLTTHINRTQAAVENSYTKASLENTNPIKKQDYGYFFPDFRIDQIDLNIGKLPKTTFKNKESVQLKPKEEKSDSSTVDSDRRDKVRFNFKLEVLLISKNGKTFKSESDNISLGGIKLVDKIPKDFLCLDFSVTIINRLEKDPKKARIHFNTKFVGDITDPCRLVFVNPDKTNKELLEKLINNYIKQAKTA
ncbi:MAG: PilZ domain-containing protein [Bdellovibrionaceae bacterium]|nr:PilZ domain-containing protein [Pseudobdellovibrionaceae bacterium]NUM60258.1 PilZ domain-containing protein [Pseudobdellovibrionaceae bacterium]